MRLSFYLSLFLAGAATSSLAIGEPVQQGQNGTLIPAKAFHSVKQSVYAEARRLAKVKTIPVIFTDLTSPAEILDMIPAKNSESTASKLQGVFWMRGNPLADYLLSFANVHWTTHGGTPYGFLSIYAPGSFVFKKSALATDANPGNYKYVPEICRVPRDDRALLEIAKLKSSHQPPTYRRDVAIDLAEVGKPGSTDGVTPNSIENFLNSVWNTGQIPKLDGDALLQLTAKLQLYYGIKLNKEFTEGMAHVLQLNRLPIGPEYFELPGLFAAFSFAPHPYDGNVYIRKSYVRGTSMPNYYWLTRIIDGNGQATEYFRDFIDCTKQRSGGEVLKVSL